MEKKTRPFGVLDQVGYVCGDMAGSFVNLFVDAYFLTFCTYVLGINPAWMATLFLVARLWDAINDPIMGSFPDRWRLGKSGDKFKPWIKLFMIPLALSGILCFSKVSFTGVALHAWVAFVYILYGMSYTGTSMPFGAMTIASLGSLPVMIICFILVPKIVAKFGKRNVILVMSAYNLVLSALILFFPIQNVMLYTILNLLATIGQTAFAMLIWALVTDCLDYSEWKMNIRSDGSMYSLYTFSRKIGSTIASTGAASALAAIGYVSGAGAVQAAATVNNIYYLVNAVPVITCILELIGIGLIFNLDQKATETMYAELAERRANGTADEA